MCYAFQKALIHCSSLIVGPAREQKDLWKYWQYGWCVARFTIRFTPKLCSKINASSVEGWTDDKYEQTLKLIQIASKQFSCRMEITFRLKATNAGGRHILFRWHWYRGLEFKQIERVVKTPKMFVAPSNRPLVFTMGDLYNIPVYCQQNKNQLKKTMTTVHWEQAKHQRLIDTALLQKVSSHQLWGWFIRRWLL